MIKCCFGCRPSDRTELDRSPEEPETDHVMMEAFEPLKQETCRPNSADTCDSSHSVAVSHPWTRPKAGRLDDNILTIYQDDHASVVRIKSLPGLIEIRLLSNLPIIRARLQLEDPALCFHTFACRLKLDPMVAEQQPDRSTMQVSQTVHIIGEGEGEEVTGTLEFSLAGYSDKMVGISFMT